MAGVIVLVVVGVIVVVVGGGGGGVIIVCMMITMTMVVLLLLRARCGWDDSGCWRLETHVGCSGWRRSGWRRVRAPTCGRSRVRNNVKTERVYVETLPDNDCPFSAQSLFEI